MKTYLIIIGLISILLIINLSGCIDEKVDDSVKFTIVSLKAEPSIINKGEKIILSWEVIKAQTVTINNGIGSLNNEGERTIYPHESTIYQLTAKNETKILTATVEITVIENINDSEDIDQDINITPIITITKDESFNNLRIVQVDSGVKWENINITATDGSTIYNYINNNNYIMVGDTLFFDGKGLSGSITIRFWYIPTDKLIATYTLNGVIP
ncbi:MAG: hypothetical protein KAJ21_04935 [Thermoplasmatales archaeon]|nr:hypothetical protein [Thermoplasmatales archaeon]